MGLARLVSIDARARARARAGAYPAWGRACVPWLVLARAHPYPGIGPAVG